MRRLNLGCADVQPAGWVNADVADWGQPHRCDARSLPWPDGHFDGIVSNHMLQMVAWPDLVATLAEMRRVAADGWVRVLVPDLDAAVDARARGDADHFVIDDAHEVSIDGKLCMYLTQAGATRSLFTCSWLLELMRRAGFADPCPVPHGRTRSPWPWLADLDTRPAESIIVEAAA